MTKKLLVILLGMAWLTSMAGAADTLLYINFDQAADGTYADGDPYTLGDTERYSTAEVDTGNLQIVYRNNNGDGPSIGTPTGVSGVAQGGKALLVDSGSLQDEGLMIQVDNGIAPQDVTIEAVWFTTDASGGSNTAGIQSIIGNEWPFGERMQMFLRTVGATRFDYWTDRGDSDGEKVDGSEITANTWYHDAMVFDYNDTDPANSVIKAYRNGSLVGTSSYDATDVPTCLFATGQETNRRFAVGIHNSVDANFDDHRGLIGGVDAIAISLGDLSVADEFVLPGGDWVPVEISAFEIE